MDLRWLSAPDDEVAAAMATARRDSRPRWVPTRRRVLVHVNHCLILWYLCVVFVSIGVRVDVDQDGRAEAADIGSVVIALAILAAWLYGTYWLYRWAARPPSPRARLREWRQTLTALANGYTFQPSSVATFEALITSSGRSVREYPRFTGPGVEFGNLVNRSTRSARWHYLAVTLSAPLPHLILDATSNDRLRTDLPAAVGGNQRLSLEGDFDRWFRAYSPVEYGTDALYLLTPDVMTALIDGAGQYNVEIVDDTMVFFTAQPADFTEATHWRSIETLLSDVVPRITAKTTRYLDRRVPGQDVPRVLTAIRAAVAEPGVPWVAPRPRIDSGGRRLDLRDRRTGILSVLGAIGWFAILAFLYAVPGIFAFAGFMSVVDSL